VDVPLDQAGCELATIHERQHHEYAPFPLIGIDASEHFAAINRLLESDLKLEPFLRFRVSLERDFDRILFVIFPSHSLYDFAESAYIDHM